MAQDEAELAGVMAHEIAHVAARHATRQMTERKCSIGVYSCLVGGGVGLAMRGGWACDTAEYQRLHEA